MASDLTTADPTNDTDAVAALTAAGKCKQAVELAKELHKKLRTPESERQLVTAYLARIAQFQSKGMTKDADTLIALVQDRFPAYRDQLVTLKVRAAAGSGRIDELVAPLARADTPAELRATIETALRQNGVDLAALAASPALPGDHPLRVAAAAIQRAFDAVTAGPVDDAALALPEVSFRSPLAPWKMLVRAIGAFYRNDDAGCRRAAEAIPADAAVHKLVAALLGMVDGKPTTTGTVGALQAKVSVDDAPLRSHLGVIESALEYVDSQGLQSAIRSAMRLCAAAQPDRLERLRQHIEVACAVRDVPRDLVRAAMPAARADAYFWRLLAREKEVAGWPAEASLYWQRFVVHAVAERMFPILSPEAALVYRQAGAQLVMASDHDIFDVDDAGGPGALIGPFYVGQPPEIAALAPKPDDLKRTVALSANSMFARSITCEPDVETYRMWWAWAHAEGEKDKFLEDIAKDWHAKRPTDVEPLLHLGDLAESRNALKMALGYLSAAEAIDPLNPAVRRARLRLTMAVTVRHLRDKKPHLAEKDLADLDQLPGMRDGDRAGCLAALRAVWVALGTDAAANAAAEAEAVAAVVKQVGPLAAEAILRSLGQLVKFPAGRSWAGLTVAEKVDPRDAARAEAIVVNLARDTGLALTRPIRWNEPIAEALRERPCPLSLAELRAIGEFAVNRPSPLHAYLASAAGLTAAAGPGSDARFLLIRAGSLTAYYTDRRASQCLRAALELARQSHEADLINQVLTAIDRHPYARRALADGRSGEGITPEQLADVLKHERQATTLPTTAAAADKHVVLPDPPRRMAASPFEMFDGFGDFDDGYDDDDDDEDDDDGADAFDFQTGTGSPSKADVDRFAEQISPESLRQLQEAIRKLGHFPSPAEMMKLDPKLLIELIAAIGTAAGGTGKGGGSGRANRRRR